MTTLSSYFMTLPSSLSSYYWYMLANLISMTLSWHSHWDWPYVSLSFPYYKTKLSLIWVCSHFCFQKRIWKTVVPNSRAFAVVNACPQISRIHTHTQKHNIIVDFLIFPKLRNRSSEDPILPAIYLSISPLKNWWKANLKQINYQK